jgi:uncharacterized protein
MTGESQPLAALLATIDPIAVAVSGGVDSMTLATLAGRLPGARATMFHAVSAAVPPDATARVERTALREGWQLQLIRPGELEHDAYVRNPVDRCLHCKRALYTTIRPHTTAQIVSGANLDDLGDYRPGLIAARESDVRHPYVEAGITKAGVRRIARELGLTDIAELPASPCLSSRVETGIPIAAPTLGRIDAAERLLRAATGAATVRCRVRHGGLAVEMDGEALARLTPAERGRLGDEVRRLFGGNAAAPSFEPYRTGSAFVHSHGPD